MKKFKYHIQLHWYWEDRIFIFIPTIAFGACLPEYDDSYWLAFMFGPMRLGFKLVDNNITQE